MMKKWISSDLGMGVVLLVLAIAATVSVGYTYKVYQQRKLILTAMAEEKSKPINNVVMRTNFGVITVQLNSKAPGTKDNFVKLVREGFYDGLRFHRVVNGFAIQAGDPLSRDVGLISQWGSQGPGYEMEREVSESDQMLRGSVVMANSGDKDNGSQFMILVTDSPWLAGKNTILGQVTNGMETVDAISSLPTGVTNIPSGEVILLSVEVE